MPRFERAKGKFLYEIHLYGSTLSVREWSQGENRLAGYCMFANAAEASREQERLSRKKSAEGFLPVDESAKALAAALKLEPPKPKGNPALPMRQDIHVYNEATGFTIASIKLAGKSIEDDSRKWNKAVQDGLLIPVSLFQDDSFVIRVVTCDALTAQEQEEWVGRLEGHLNLANGKLCISAGAEWLYEGTAAAGLADDNFVRIVDLPAGDYRATLYSYFSGVNGGACLDELAGGYGKAEPAGQWFRRTRLEERFPEWLVYQCIAHADSDPGHEQEWLKTPLPDSATMPEFIDFVLHLEAVEQPSTVATTTKAENGWFSMSAGARKPERCPLGLVAKDVIGHEQKAEGNWLWPREISPLVEGFDPVPIAGGEVIVPLDQLDDVYRLATFCCFNLLPEIRVTLPPGAIFQVEGVWPQGMIAVAANDAVRFLLAPGNGRLGALQALTASLDRLKMLPEGTTLEMVTSALEHQAPPKSPRPIGTHRYYGTVHNGAWHIERTFPAVNAERLRAALAVAAESRLCAGFKVRDEEEARQILKCSEANNGTLLEDNPPFYEGGVIRLREPDANFYNRVGGAVFTVRHSDVWPLVDFSKDE